MTHTRLSIKRAESAHIHVSHHSNLSLLQTIDRQHEQVHPNLHHCSGMKQNLGLWRVLKLYRAFSLYNFQAVLIANAFPSAILSEVDILRTDQTLKDLFNCIR
jgi:hypothetical protein